MLPISKDNTLFINNIEFIKCYLFFFALYELIPIFALSKTIIHFKTTKQMNLKTLLLKMGCAIVLVTLSAPIVLAKKMVVNDGTTIILVPRNTDVPDYPRSSVPFFAEYNAALSAVMLGCNASVGDVTVTLTSTAGDWYQTVFDTSDGAILIPVSGDAGYYTLTIETAAHVVYEGEFYL